MRFTRLLAAILALTLPTLARANGRFPTAQHVVVGPGAQSSTIALRTTFGFAISDDSGATFHWACEEFLGYAGPAYDPPVVIDRAARLELGLSDGLLQVSTDRCTANRIPAAANQYMVDLDVSPDGSSVVGVTSNGSPGSLNAVIRSDDGGDTFTRLGAGVGGVLFETLEMAPTNLQRVYLTAVQISPRVFQFYRSDDGGATLTLMPFPMGNTVTGAFIAGVDPSNADTVYVRGQLPAPTDGGPVTGATALYRTRDGGSTWETLTQTVGPMLGFAISDDGRTLWVGGSNAQDGLSRSDDGGTTWQQVRNDVPVLCLRQHAGALYVCSNFVLSGYALGRSDDGGETIQPLLRFQDLMPPFACPSDSLESSACGARWPMIRNMFVTDAGSPPPDANASDAGTVRDSAVGMDATDVHDDGTMTRTGCGCSTRGTPRSGALPLLALAAFAFARRKRVSPN